MPFDVSTASTVPARGKHATLYTYMVSGVPYVKVYQYNLKHLCPKLNGYGDNGQRSLKL
jgi:hypothetical protein